MNKILSTLISVSAIILFIIPTIGNTETLPLITLEFPPWNYKDKNSGKIIGASVEIVTDILDRMGYEVKIDLKPWKRGQKETAEGKYAGIFTLTKSPTRLKYYYYADPISTITEVFFKRTDRNISWKTLEDLKGLRVGVVGGYNYVDDFKKARKAGYFQIQAVSLERGDYVNLRKLKHGRIDLFICVLNVCSYIIKSKSEELGEIDYINKPIGRPRFFYFAFSKKWPDALKLREKFNGELKKYVKDGKRDEVHKKYGMVMHFDESVDGVP